jgi:hypothetical protein
LKNGVPPGDFHSAMLTDAPPTSTAPFSVVVFAAAPWPMPVDVS